MAGVSGVAVTVASAAGVAAGAEGGGGAAAGALTSGCVVRRRRDGAAGVGVAEPADAAGAAGVTGAAGVAGAVPAAEAGGVAVDARLRARVGVAGAVLPAGVRRRLVGVVAAPFGEMLSGVVPSAMPIPSCWSRFCTLLPSLWFVIGVSCRSGCVGCAVWCCLIVADGRGVGWRRR